MALTAHKQRKADRRQRAQARRRGEAQHSQRQHTAIREAREKDAQEFLKKTGGKLTRALRRFIGGRQREIDERDNTDVRRR